MPSYVSPPVFSDGSILTATDLNKLSGNQEYLYGLYQAPNIPFNGLVSGQSLTSSNNLWYMRYSVRYLHYYASIHDTGLGNTINTFKIYINSVLRVEDTLAPRTLPFTWSGYADMNPFGLTAGTVYPIYFDVSVGSQAAIRIAYLIASDSTTL